MMDTLAKVLLTVVVAAFVAMLAGGVVAGCTIGNERGQRIAAWLFLPAIGVLTLVGAALAVWSIWK